jgi:Aspartyl protease
METKTFEHLLQFFEVLLPNGSIWLPIVTVNLIQPTGTRVALPLLFDTGASVTTLREDLYPLLGVPSWNSGTPLQVATAGGSNSVSAYQYQAKLELLGREVECPVNLQVLPRNPLYVGLFGRERIFSEFGFGFWESTHQLHITLTP